jgi:alkylation response protein AidB-like acyl-CoA dehydrogenase
MLLSDRANAFTEKLAPGLITALTDVGLAELERDSATGIDIFRTRGRTGMFVPENLGGADATATAALHYMLTLGSLAPSLSIVATMHHFSVASLAKSQQDFDELESFTLTAIATDNLLVSSAFAEARPGAGMFEPSMTATRDADVWLVNGSKKPCTMSRSMDLISASVRLDGDDAGYAIMVAPATLPGISTHPFWQAPVLRAAESDEVRLENVPVPDDCIIRPNIDPQTGIDNLQKNGLIWFCVLASASYLGMVVGLVNKIQQSGRADDRILGEYFLELNAALNLLEGVARTVDEGLRDPDATLADCLTMRFSIVETIARMVPRALETLGGVAFISDPAVGLLAASANALVFHPPTRRSIIGELGRYSVGSAMRFS